MGHGAGVVGWAGGGGNFRGVRRCMVLELGVVTRSCLHAKVVHTSCSIRLLLAWLPLLLLLPSLQGIGAAAMVALAAGTLANTTIVPCLLLAFPRVFRLQVRAIAPRMAHVSGWCANLQESFPFLACCWAAVPGVRARLLWAVLRPQLQQQPLPGWRG
jgi:hypothetical protein